MYRIRIFVSRDVTRDPDSCKTKFETICQTHLNSDYGPDKKYYITNSDDYSHAILLNTAMPELKPDIPVENVIGFAWEPIPFLHLTYEFIQYAMKHISNYYIGDATGLPYPFVEGNPFLWYNTPPRTIAPKNNLMSIMVSFKSIAIGHTYRHTLVKEILKHSMPIDIYGNGCKYYEYANDSRIKGKFELNEPYESYMFHIAIEKFQTNEYFSEKIINPLLHDCVPLYLGARNIDKYFKGMYIPLNGDVHHDIEVIREVLVNPDRFYRQYKPDTAKTEQTVNLFKNDNIDQAYGGN